MLLVGCTGNWSGLWLVYSANFYTGAKAQIFYDVDAALKGRSSTDRDKVTLERRYIPVFGTGLGLVLEVLQTQCRSEDIAIGSYFDWLGVWSMAEIFDSR